MRLFSLRSTLSLLTGMALMATLLVGGRGAWSEEARPTAALSWQDVSGRKYALEDVQKAKSTVFLFVSTQCPIANGYTPRLLELAKDYQPKGVRFFLVDSNAEDSAAEVKKYAAERKIPFPAVKDNGTALADRLNADTTPQAVILDSAGEIRYLGRIDDHRDREKVAQHDVRNALDALLAGQPVKHPRTLPFGCAIFRDKAAPKLTSTAKVTYARDVAPILFKNCVVCHRSGEVAPFALETYAQAKTWARAIKDYTARRIMPPWKPVAGHGDFHDARGLSDAQIAQIAQWTEAGAPEGNKKDMPPAPKFPNPKEWTLGTPDVVLQPVAAYHLEAEGRDVYRNFVLPIDFKEDRYVQGIEFKPDNRAVVHHIVTYVDVKGVSVKLDGKEKEPGYTVPGVGIGVFEAEYAEVWVPGNSARMFPPGVALKIPAGAKLVMQVHYHKSGKPEVDRSQMAMHYAKGSVEKTMQVNQVANFSFELKPGLADQEVKGSLRLPVDVTLYNMFPHMHMLGKDMKVTATLPDGTVKKLIWINDWDFNWQATYYYKEPIKLPKGTRLDMVAHFDNSAQNPRQTSLPPRTVRFGEQTTDEMCLAIFGLTLDSQNLAASQQTTSGSSSGSK